MTAQPKLALTGFGNVPFVGLSIRNAWVYPMRAYVPALRGRTFPMIGFARTAGHAKQIFRWWKPPLQENWRGHNVYV